MKTDTGDPSAALPGRVGTCYEDTVPDTLDLAERARLGLNYFTEIIQEHRDYEMCLSADLDKSRPPYMRCHTSDIGACQAKAMEAMAFLRLMSGSAQNLEREGKMVDMMVSLLGEDGLHWVPGRSDRPWLGIPEPFAMIHGQGRMLRAMMAWYQYTGDPDWKRRADRMVDGMDRVLAVHREDYAYFPIRGFYEKEYMRSCYTRRGWKDTAEPSNEKSGEEGSLFNHQGHIPGALANWYGLTGNEQALRLSGELVRFYTRPQFWADFEQEYPMVAGAEHAHWQGHFHGYLNTLRAILEYAVAANDARLKAFVRDGYEWARQAGFARIGYVGDVQGCGCGRLIGLAVKLTDAGVGDYWEDVDQYIHNQGVEMQIMPEDRDYLWSLSEGKPAPPDQDRIAGDVASTDRVIERIMGGFAGRIAKNVVWLCCSPHGGMGLFYAWDGTLRHADGVVRVNLLLNRASPWMDVHSHLPYEGRVVLKNKTAREAFARIPLWVDRSSVRATLGGKELTNVWFGNYLRFEGLRPGDALTLRFPMVETTEWWTVPKLRQSFPGPDPQVHACRFKGNTLVEISPPLVPGCPLYSRRSHYLKNEAPMTKVTRFVTPQRLKW
ncbi:hypothetical protein HYY27_04755 [bacterium]|nr:hypothetical protein [bacterium]